MVNYSNSKIYKIINSVNDLIYIGSTTQPLSKRMVRHRTNTRLNLFSEKHKLYNLMKELGCENFNIILIENFICNNKEELLAKEAYYIRQFDTIKNGLNGLIPINDEINKEEMRIKNIDYNKNYYELNKEIFKENQKAYRNNHIEQYKNYSKIYRENNIEKIKELDQKYKEKNKDKLKEKFICVICGGKYTYASKTIHIKTNKHQKIDIK